jgi:two-component system OmpR family sensor kinase
VLTNLLENVTRHTPVGTNVRVIARDVGPRVEIVVEDDGPGMPRARRSRLRDPEANTGIGLAICAAFIDQLDGTMRIDDRPGGGTRVTIWLPRQL